MGGGDGMACGGRSDVWRWQMRLALPWLAAIMACSGTMARGDAMVGGLRRR